MRFLYPLLDRKKPPPIEAMFIAPESAPDPGPMPYSAGGDAIVTIHDAYQCFVLDAPPIKSAYLPPQVVELTQPSWRLKLSMAFSRLRHSFQPARA
jgi:hypothetical protein